MTYRIRRGTHADADLLTRFNHAMAQESEDKPLDLARLKAGITALLDSPADGYYLIADDERGEPAGALMLTFEWSDWRNGRFWWIQSVYVRPEHRRKGVYSALHAHVRDAARADPKACGLRLYVERENTGAQATYRAMGMVETHYRLYEEEFVRGRTLASATR
ncbi:MAG TPA: N-acetyltransferase [Pseudomonadales bacterium]|nr:N-acetyltransferase [Pseudomonadales bacterium]